MIGYAYIDNDRNLSIRNKEYIEVEDPGFWDRNSHLIDTVWIFNTEDEYSMYRLMSSFRRLELQSSQVIDFCKSINFDLQQFLSKNSSTKPPAASIPDLSPTLVDPVPPFIPTYSRS